MKRIRKWVLWGMGVVLFVIFLAALGLFLTPRLVSTQWFKHQVESNAANVLHRPVHIKTLLWSWTDGIRINGLTMGDSPSFSEKPLFSIDHASLKIDMGSLLRRRLVFLFNMQGVRVLLVRHEDGRTNLEALVAAFGPPSKQTKEKGESRLLPFLLPEDVVATIGVKALTIQIDDRLQGRALLIHNASLRLTAPSLQQKPVYLLVSSEQTLDGSPLPPLRLGVSVTNLLTPSWRLDANHLSLNAEGNLPGLEFSLKGGLRQKEVHATLGLDLGLISDALGPVVSTSLPETSGRMDIIFDGSRQTDDDITFHLDITGKGMSAKRGLLKGLEIAPVNLNITNEGVLYPHAKTLKITEGDLRIQEKTCFPWKGTLRRLESGVFGVDLIIGPLMIDFDEVTRVLKGIMPSDITIEQKKGHGNSKPSQLAIDKMAINGTLPHGESTIQLNGLKLNLAALKAHVPGGMFKAKDIRFHVNAAEAVLSSGFPSRLNLSSGLIMDAVYLEGPNDLKIGGVELNTLSLKGAHMSPSEKGLTGVTGDVSLETAGTFKGISAPSWGSVTSLSHRFEASLHLSPSPAATIENMLFSVDLMPPADLRRLDTKLEQSIHMTCKLKGGRIQKSGAIQIDAEQMTADLDMGNLFKGYLAAGFKNSGSERLKTDGHIALDAGKLLALLPTARRPKGRLTGRMDLEWTFSGRRPRPGEIQRIIDGQQPLSTIIQEAPFIQHLKLLTRLKNVGIDLRLSDQDRVIAGGIYTPSPLILELEEGLNRVDLKGGLTCAQINQIPRLGTLDPSLGVQMGVSLHLENFKTAQISQSLKIAPLNLEENLTGSVDHLDRIIDPMPQLDPAQILRLLDAVVSTRIQMDLARVLGDRLAHMSAAGTLSAGADLTLAGDNHLTADMNMKASSIDFQKDQAQVNRLQADLQVNRRFKIESAHHQKRRKATATPLSRKVLYPPSPNTGFRGLNQPWPGSFGYLSLGPPNLTFETARIPTGPLFLNVSNGQIAIDLAGPLPSLDHFQVDVLGGSVTGNLGLSEGPDVFMLGANCSFSGLDMRRLSGDVREAAIKEEAGSSPDSEISGRLTVNLPLSDDPMMLLNRMRTTVRLTHIGSQTLERFLYALDPYESNEMMVKQRKLLRQGTPRWIEIQIKDGNLSLKGEVEVKEALIRLPEIRRFNVALLPISDRLNEQAPKLRHLMQLLNILVSDTILVNQGEGLKLIRGETP